MAAQPSLRARAVLAVALTVTFYALALAIGLALIVAPIAVLLNGGPGNGWLAVASIGAGLAVLRSIVPERDRFTPPGPELTAAAQPELFAMLKEVAVAAGQRPADAVYLDIDVNAGVLERKGRRILLVGLPLLATLDRDELRAVVAHEYGHFASGDTRFGAWIWRTRVAVMKTVHRLATSRSWFRRNVVRWPFVGYSQLFLRITNAISRRAELGADALSARVASADAAGRALRRIAAAAPAYDSFWSADLVPMLRADRRPPIAAGFAGMVANADLRPALERVVEADLEAEEADVYASHPTLRERLTALGLPPDGSMPPPPGTPASALLRDLPALERGLLVARFGPETADLRAADWDDAGAVHLEGWRLLVQRFGAALPAGALVADAGAIAADLPAHRSALRRALDPRDADAPDAAHDALLGDLLGAAVIVAAVDAGATVTAAPGEPVIVANAGETLRPFDELAAIVRGAEAASDWAPRIDRLGVAAAPLAAGATPVAADAG